MEELFLDPNPEESVLFPWAEKERGRAITKVKVKMTGRTLEKLATLQWREGSGWEAGQIHVGDMGQNQPLGKSECWAEEIRFQKRICALHLSCQGFCC